ncbi:hypothetical protein N7539_006311 [Penicillium diatomitis]|uniref:Uncharacterized protein n=1 Tax=Penicillium diatomitis TaxID=2819901 RepID=A0A9W9X3H8_9EURO|nr:uncharacterized protein N7539_006311 [Penicillium diatomitis]KAJ5482865.1 hypothetical protein N7539_006311 [Penicillium diatomitis]
MSETTWLKAYHIVAENLESNPIAKLGEHAYRLAAHRIISPSVLRELPFTFQGWGIWAWTKVPPLASPAIIALLNCLKLTHMTLATGSLAAKFQSVMYGAFTPGGGIFATLTSLGMRGILQQAVQSFALPLGSAAAVVTAWLIF